MRSALGVLRAAETSRELARPLREGQTPRIAPALASGKQSGESGRPFFVNRHDLAIQDDGVDGKPSQRPSESWEPVA